MCSHQVARYPRTAELAESSLPMCLVRLKFIAVASSCSMVLSSLCNRTLLLSCDHKTTEGQNRAHRPDTETSTNTQSKTTFNSSTGEQQKTPAACILVHLLSEQPEGISMPASLLCSSWSLSMRQGYKCPSVKEPGSSSLTCGYNILHFLPEITKYNLAIHLIHSG